jgi:predicted nucleotidyltransferase component of viral defense system
VSESTPRNVEASVRDRLLALARQRGEDFQQLLTRYGGERLLYRLSLSEYRDRFILKGARLFEIWTGEAHRPTRDLDFLGHGSSDIAQLVQTFQEICRQPVPAPDGLVFPAESISGEPARVDQEYQGASLKLLALLGKARIPLQVDFGFGDVITPGAALARLPTLLDQPSATLRTYPRETVVAEKFHAMVSLGIANSRLKDFYDIWYLAREFDFEGTLLKTAIAATFARRETQLPSRPPLALTAEFYEDPQKRTQWSRFVDRNKLQGADMTLYEVTEVLNAFLMPPALAAQTRDPFDQVWSPAAGAWQPGLTEG